MICLLASSILVLSCGINNQDRIDEVRYPDYVFTVENATGNIQTYTGKDAIWLPDIGHMELGPENTPNKAVASLWLTFKEDSIDLETFQPVEGYVPNYSFYSILYPWMDLGEQESNWYDFKQGCPGTSQGFIIDSCAIGIDNRGVSFIRGKICIEMDRAILNSADVPEWIRVTAKFTATER
jgi:hypothetical protein